MNKRYELQEAICKHEGWFGVGDESKIKYLHKLTEEQLRTLWDCLQLVEGKA